MEGKQMSKTLYKVPLTSCTKAHVLVWAADEKDALQKAEENAFCDEFIFIDEQFFYEAEGSAEVVDPKDYLEKDIANQEEVEEEKENES
jgi:hypothetical protein